MNKQSSIISVENLSKEFKVTKKRGFLKDLFKPEYRKVYAVNDISFNIQKGEAVAFLGPNGAGKTTTIKMLTGLIYPTAGTISVLDYFPFDRKKEYLMKIGLVMGNKAGLNWDLTPNQSFQLLRQIYKIPQDVFKERVEELTELLNTKKFLDHQVRKLSLGERMKMELIGAILHNPDVLFLDEPTIGLDIISKQKIREFLRGIQKKYDITILLTSHDMDDVEKVCDRVIVINDGKKVYDDAIETLMNKYKQERYVKFVFKTMPSESSIKESIIPDVVITERDTTSLTFTVPQSHMPTLISEITSKFEVDDIDILSIPLETVIADIFQNNGTSEQK